MNTGQRLAVLLVATGIVCLVVATYLAYGLVPALAVAGIAMVVAGPGIGISSS